ncbi:uncharacterized protein LOC131956158 [Physella acuta]|uniref:uncharacterized protein LOC131956158 n=1 Tax=Physella acuta TaxID=109671 RepID=UPI0027DEA528|nr:uncharacterized protein LOC131956158 [Physella acuta]
MEPENIQSIEKTDGKTHPKTDVRHEKKKRDSHKSRRKIANEDSTKQKGISSEGSSMANIESPKSTSKDTVSPLTPSAAPDISVLLNQQNQDKGVKYDMFQQAMTPSTDVTIKKPPINADDLLIKKRMLKKVDRHSEYNPVTLSRKELFEEEFEKSGNIPPEYLPIHIVKPIIIQQNLSADLVTLNLNGIDQLTDFLFAHLHGGGMTTVPKFSNLKKLNMVGCTNISDQGLIWITRLFPDIQMLEVNACRKITEKGLHYLFSNCNKLQNVSAMATNAAIIPDSYEIVCI